MLCSANDSNTRQANWEIPDTPIQVFNVNGITFRNNSFATDSNCARSVANYAAPIYLVNCTNVVGVSGASRAAAGPAAADGGAASLQLPLQLGGADYANSSAELAAPAAAASFAQQAGGMLSFQNSAGTLT